MRDSLQARWSVAKALLAAGVLFGAAGCAADPEASDGGSTSTTSTSTTVAQTTTTTRATTTTTRATTTTTRELQAPEAVLIFLVVFSRMREDLIGILNSDSNVSSVDGFVAETEDDLEDVKVILDVTSRWASPDNQHDGAWEITRAMALLWHPENGVWHNEVWSPAFRLVNSGRTYECPAEFMIALADARSSRAAWEETCA